MRVFILYASFFRGHYLVVPERGIYFHSTSKVLIDLQAKARQGGDFGTKSGVKTLTGHTKTAVPDQGTTM